MKHTVHFSSDRDDWATPAHIVRALEKRSGYPFDLDPCAGYWLTADGPVHTAKAPNFYVAPGANPLWSMGIGPAEDGLAQPWFGHVFVNPPYGRGLADWLTKAIHSTRYGNAKTVTLLLPARTDTAWWHDCVLRRASDVLFVRGRIRFDGAPASAPFPSVVLRYTMAAADPFRAQTHYDNIAFSTEGADDA